MLTPKQVNELVASKASYLAHQAELLDIYGGNLSDYVAKEFAGQVSFEFFQYAKKRLSPINILPKVIDKLTNIYQTPVVRRVDGGRESDADLLGLYSMGLNESMNLSNELYNLCRTSLIYPYIFKGRPKYRVIQNDRFVVYSDDPMNPEVPTHVILLAGFDANGKKIFWVWSKDEFQVIDSNEEIRRDLMAQFDNPQGVNPVGVLPFVYVNSSKANLTPPPDYDALKIVKLLPVMLSDLNAASMFQCFSILYTVDVNDADLKFSPNAIWNLKSDATTDKKPEVGSIKPTVDYDQVLKLIMEQLSLWLATKGIRPATVGALGAENFASGISKVIDEMDTFEARQKQVTTYLKAEKDFWKLITESMHPYWVGKGELEGVSALFTPGAEVLTRFAVQLPQQSRGQIVRDVKEEYAAGFISRREAVAMLNPELTEEQIDEKIRLIDLERGSVTEEEEDNASETPVSGPEDTEDSDEESEDGVS